MEIQFHANILWQRRHSDFVHISTLSSFGYSNREKYFMPCGGQQIALMPFVIQYVIVLC